jgi:hypothetical protein
MIRTPEEVFDRQAHALGDGNLDGCLIRVPTVGCAVQHSRSAATRKEVRR